MSLNHFDVCLYVCWLCKSEAEEKVSNSANTYTNQTKEKDDQSEARNKIHKVNSNLTGKFG